MPTIVLWVVVSAFAIARLPRQPVLTPDSASYILHDSTRPPAYPWLLDAYAWAVRGAAPSDPGALEGLPWLQGALVALALLAFAVELDRLLGRRWAGAIAVVAVWTHVATFEATRWVMSEGLFLPAALLGLALAFAHARRGDGWTLAGAAACLALASLARTAGLALLAVPLLLVLLDPARRGLGRRIARLALPVCVAALVLAAGAADHAARSGRPGLGGGSGVSMLGKALLLLPAPGQVAPPDGQAAGWAAAAERAAAARAAIAAPPGLLPSLRAQSQAYETLRWPVPRSAEEAAWTESWGWGRGDAAARNARAARVARDVFAADPWGYLRLAARDWLSLVLLPNLWPEPVAGGDSRHPFFARCHEAPETCWAFFRLPVPLPYAVLSIAASLGGLLASVAVAALAAAGRLRRDGGLAPAERCMLAFALTAQATLLATAAFEAGLWRYVVVVNAMNAALLAWALHRVLARAAATGTARRGRRGVAVPQAPR